MKTSEDFSKLKKGDEVLLSGKVYIARDLAHKKLLEEDFDLKIDVIYHCGPLFKGDEIVSAGPTTSKRMEPYTKEVVEKYGVRGIIGKGGMEVPEGVVYFEAVGGAGALLAKKIKSWKKIVDLGPVESILECEVEEFPVIVSSSR
ncbi:MAG: fumarate hydratase C-terminal domain-containing protein [archaeon]